MDRDQLRRLRAAVDADGSGEEFVVREVWTGADPLRRWIDTHVTAVEKAQAS